MRGNSDSYRDKNNQLENFPWQPSVLCLLYWDQQLNALMTNRKVATADLPAGRQVFCFDFYLNQLRNDFV